MKYTVTMVTKEEIDSFLPMESEKLEILVDLLNGVYTVEAFKEDYRESKEVYNV
tara:strand:+ start:995 stop:1156 length:162 start_codon:yes stop_codon:yes gene_type:complete